MAVGTFFSLIKIFISLMANPLPPSVLMARPVKKITFLQLLSYHPVCVSVCGVSEAEKCLVLHWTLWRRYLPKESDK